MTRDTKVQLAAGVVLLASLAMSGVTATSIASSAGRHHLTYTDQAQKGAPPQVALGIAMGAFRGIFVNFLWIRANSLKQDGKYFESIELANAITELQPRFPRVWVFHAWNLAYNISVGTQTRDERWQWVNAGIRMLRDRGIPNNPNDMLLHKELGWIFLHKIQGYTDDANQYYKRRLAEEWHSLLGPPPYIDPRERDPKTATKIYADWLRVVADAPTSREELAEKSPRAVALLELLRSDLNEEPGLNLLRRYQMNLEISKTPEGVLVAKTWGPKNRRLAQLIADPENAEAWPVLLAYVRRHVLVHEYHMEPARMVRYTEDFGPIDWRNPAAHGLYWSHRGEEEALDRRTDENRNEFDFLNTDRVTVHAVQELFRTGDLYFDYLRSGEPTSLYMAMPDPYFTDSYGKFIREASERSWADNSRKRAWSAYQAGLENFLKDATRFFYRRGDRGLAEKYLHELRVLEDQNLNNPFRAEELSDLDEFVRRELKDRYTSPYVAVQEVNGSLLGAYSRGLLGGDDEVFKNSFEYAVMAHRYYFEEQMRNTPVDPTDPRVAVMERDFPLMAGSVFMQFVLQLPPEDAQAVYARAPEDLRRYAYDYIAQNLRGLYDEAEKEGGQPFATAFPEPPGMAAHRERIARLFRERGGSTPAFEQK
jgi:hypothetical protein